MTAILNEHPAQRLVRNLYPAEIPALPFISSLMVKIGQAVDSVDNGVRLLEQEELVGVFPERLLFAGGDIVTGGATVILAMGAGRNAASAIDGYLTTGEW